MDDHPRFISDEPKEYQEEFGPEPKNDCPDDSFTRRIRPTSVVMMLVFFVIIVLADGNWGGFHVNPGYYPIIETVLATMIIAYFGSRGFEKSVRSWERGQYHSRRREYHKTSFRRPSSRSYEEEDYEGED